MEEFHIPVPSLYHAMLENANYFFLVFNEIKSGLQFNDEPVCTFNSLRHGDWISIGSGNVLVPWNNEPLTRYAKFRVAHAPGIPGTFSPPPRVSDPDMHHGTFVTHVPGCMLGSLTSGFLWSRWRGKRSQHSRRMRNPQFYLSGKRPILTHCQWCLVVFTWALFHRKGSGYLGLI